MGDVVNMHGVLKIEHLWQTVHYFVFNYIFFLFIISWCLWHQIVLQVHKKMQVKMTKTESMMKITKSEINTELEWQSPKKIKTKLELQTPIKIKLQLQLQKCEITKILNSHIARVLVCYQMYSVFVLFYIRSVFISTALKFYCVAYLYCCSVKT